MGVKWYLQDPATYVHYVKAIQQVVLFPTKNISFCSCLQALIFLDTRPFPSVSDENFNTSEGFWAPPSYMVRKNSLDRYM